MLQILHVKLFRKFRPLSLIACASFLMFLVQSCKTHQNLNDVRYDGTLMIRSVSGSLPTSNSELIDFLDHSNAVP